jgi:hypothetical protein
MIVYTYQLAHWRRLQKTQVPLVDTTVKTGDVRLAPTWDMVLSIKRGALSEDDYSRLYFERLDYWWFHDPMFWDELLTHPVLAFGCYCRAGQFCHRHLLVDFLRRVTEVDYRGELTTDPDP